MPRALIIVLDGVGIGELPDAEDYGDAGSNTLGNLARAVGGLSLPCLESLGLGKLGAFQGISDASSPKCSFGVMAELSKGKDTITGHWEMMGIVSEQPFPTYPDGFPEELVREFELKSGRKTLWNRPASGTEIIKRFGLEHMNTGALIVYTSADSVFQIAAHEEIVPVDELYGICRIARDMLNEPPHNICRVIARPFTGSTPDDFTRTPRRKDFAMPPPRETLLDLLLSEGHSVVSIGKVADMFSGRGFSGTVKSAGNSDSMKKVRDLMASLSEGLVFTNLTDFDTLYGHRNDPDGFARALEAFDKELAVLLGTLMDDDFLFITADHGNDPTTPSTDHSREYVPVLFYNRLLSASDLGIRKSFADIGATLAQIFGVDFGTGRSFLLDTAGR